MSVRKVGSLTALTGGLVWVAGAVLGWGADAPRLLYYAGAVLLLGTLAAAGYSLVATAPRWLRAVVGLATPALGAMLWLIVVDAVPEPSLALLVAGVVLVVAGGVGLARGSGGSPPEMFAHRTGPGSGGGSHAAR